MKLVFVDTETTGLDRQSDDMIELAAIRIDWRTWATESVFYRRFLPTRTVPEEAAKINGYTPETWAETRLIVGSDLNMFRSYVDGARWVGSMPQFDFDFIERARVNLGAPPFALASRRLIDVGSLGTPLLFSGYGEKGGLDELCEMLQIGAPDVTDPAFAPLARLTGGRIGPHTAMGDAARTAKAFRRLMLGFTDPDVIESVLRGGSAPRAAVASVTDAELADIEARTSGPGPLAGDGGLLRRFASSLRTERARREDAEMRLAELREDVRARR